MSPHRAAGAVDRAQGAAPSPSPAPEAGWEHPLLDWLLRRQRRLQQLGRRHPWLLDTAVVLIVAVIGLTDLLSDGGGDGPFGNTEVRDDLPAAVSYVVSAALVVPLWWRRRAPAPVYFLIAPVALVQGALGLQVAAGIAAFIALYTMARYGSLRLLGWVAAVAVAQETVPVLVLLPSERWLQSLFFELGTVTAAAAVGLTLRTRQMYLTALEDRARRLEIERDQREQLTVAAERSRVAREMHDIVGHNLSVMISVADGAATLAANSGEQSEQSLRILGDTGRQAMSELRRVLGVLREKQHGERPLSPQPGIRDLAALLSRVRTAGLDVTYRTVGDLDTLGNSVQLTVYRIVQEALTNTLKHAGAGSAADVTVTADAGQVRIRIADTGAPPEVRRPSPQPDDPGHGLVGIRQRAALYGGTATIGPRDDRPGWIVDVVFHASDEPAPPAPGEEPLP
ncbi:two-component sensor histidine kinase [Streptomyces sp. HC44]|uniref:histidine kinase n=1 Tax=Streptomyces scabichelini TaxID=2711217 RepID=A0A6G4V9C9_9ACTN|nr:histidine kinase [Streptomyces scabichelini]NGO10722.1 two-component sensor histidine kinase [Streptomyces scabichelini]